MPDIVSRIGSSIDNLTKEFNIISNNLANVSTTGYKRRCNAFSQSLEASMESGSSDDAVSKTLLDFTQGGMIETGQRLDFALYGKGFFVLETPDGLLYTRNGNFSINKNNQLVDAAGNIVAGENGPVVIPAGTSLSNVNVAVDGNIQAGEISIGKFKLVDFKEDQDKLVSAGTSCFRMTDDDVRPTPAESLVVKQGYQEGSNVKMVDELVDMIMVSRLYEANMKLITSQTEASNNLMSVAMG